MYNYRDNYNGEMVILTLNVVLNNLPENLKSLLTITITGDLCLNVQLCVIYNINLFCLF